MEGAEQYETMTAPLTPWKQPFFSQKVGAELCTHFDVRAPWAARNARPFSAVESVEWLKQPAKKRSSSA